MELLANIATSIIGIYFISQYCQELHSGRKRIIYMAVGAFAYFITVTTLNYVMFFEGVLGFAYLLIMFFYAHVACKGNTIDHVIAIAIWACIILFSTIPVLELLSLITKCNVSQLLNSDFYLRAEALTVITALKFLLCQLVLLKKKKSNLFLSKRDGYALIGISLLILLIILGFFAMEIHADNKAIRHVISMLLFLGMVLILLLIFVIFQKLSSYYINEISREYTDKLVGKQEEYVNYIEQLNKELQIIRHDSTGHYTTLHMLLKSGKIADAIMYLAELEETIKRYSELPPITNDDNLNAILYKTFTDCKEKNIVFHYAILAQVSRIKSNDLGILLYNLLNNAIEAASRCDRKAITLEIGNYQCYLRCKITNSVCEPVLKNNPGLTTSKPNKELHGFGMDSVYQIVEKYDGYYEHYDSEGEFAQIIYLKYLI